jgi:hypothetical protein
MSHLPRHLFPKILSRNTGKVISDERLWIESKPFRPKVYVETIAGGIHRPTPPVKQEKKTYTRWDFKNNL